jgi:16S rRNA (uracil1498-N3)-methyltransferase
VLRLDAEESHHLLKVRRTPQGAEVWGITGTGTGARCVLAGTDGSAALLEVAGIVPDWREPPLRVTLWLGMVRARHMEEVLEAGTALGLARLVPMRTERTQRESYRPDRWERLAGEAAKQAGRGWIPPAEPAADLADLLARPPEGPLVVLHPDGERLLSEEAPGLPREGPLTLVVGPEGDLTLDEREALRGAGGILSSLGPRRLRTEVAALSGLAILLLRGSAAPPPHL